VINKRGTQNKYLKNKIINTDKFGDINFTKLAIVIVQITSVIDKEIPKTVFELLKFSVINIKSLKKNNQFLSAAKKHRSYLMLIFKITKLYLEIFLTSLFN
tara:strand:+ start:268 stop:570 length:303 start_codon:yes stop_codon:yes gene_type:complete